MSWIWQQTIWCWGSSCCIAAYNYTCTFTNIHLHSETSLTGNERLQSRTNTLLYKNMSLTLYSRKGDVCCVWEMSWRQGQTAILTQVLLATIAALLPHLGWGCSTVGPWGPKALCLLLALTSATCLQLTRTVWAPGYIIGSHPPASVVLLLIYTGASLDWRLGRGSIYNNVMLELWGM